MFKNLLRLPFANRENCHLVNLNLSISQPQQNKNGKNIFSLMI